MRKKVAIAGATSFIGRWFIETYRDQFDLVALSRRDIKVESKNPEWRKVDLYSYTSTLDALQGADYAIYLVHSRQPSARLNQSRFDDTDLLMADNFARAAEQNELQHIIFLGGLLPENPDQYTDHLRNRLEVEKTLGSRRTPVTSLRAGIIIGAGGSSFKTMLNLVERLPVMVCPRWCRNPTHPIGIEDLLKIIGHCLGNPEYYHHSYELGQPKPTSYLRMLKEISSLTGKKRLILNLPFAIPGLSKFWIGLFSGASSLMVAPVVESLKYDFKIEPNPLLSNFPNLKPFPVVARSALDPNQQLPPLPVAILDKPKKINTVRSVQRLPNPGNRTASWVANRYHTWLPRFFRVFLKVITDDDYATFQLLGFKLLKLKLVKDRSDHERQLFYIIDGLLVKRKDFGWLEFRQVLNGKYVMAALHEFVPSMPWYIYVNTQAVIHLWIMKKFGAYLERLQK